MTRGAAQVLVIGCRGQLARALSQISDGKVRFRCCGRLEGVDVTKRPTLLRAIDHYRPDIVVNAAAFTAVDRAEKERAAAFALNLNGPAELAGVCDAKEIPVVHISTDYVFDGAQQQPYREEDPIAPLNVYGASKAAGEAALRASTNRHIILRTSWLYSRFGENFPKTMLRLAKHKQHIDVVADQHGCPTAAEDVATAIKIIVGRVREGNNISYGTFHLTGSGATTWYDFAAAIFGIAAKYGGMSPTLRPIRAADYPAAAKRPINSILDCSKIAAWYGIKLPPWIDSLSCLVPTLVAEDWDEGHYYGGRLAPAE